MQKDEHEGKIAPAQTYIAFEPECLNRGRHERNGYSYRPIQSRYSATVNAGLNKERIIKNIGWHPPCSFCSYDLAKREEDTVVPAYTNGVQALPNRYAHYILAFCSAFLRGGRKDWSSSLSVQHMSYGIRGPERFKLAFELRPHG